MRLTTRLHAVERAVDRVRSRTRPAIDICARIEELTALYITDPPTLPPAVEAGIRALLARQEQFSAPDGSLVPLPEPEAPA